MKDFKKSNKVLFIPGWLDNGARLGYQNSLDIWNKNIDISKDFGADYVLAHSTGSLVALYNWNIYKNFKIILINPVILKNGVFRRWYQFITSEGITNSFKKSIKILSIIPSIIKMKKLFKVSAFDIINTIPKENLIIVYGENDKYLFDREIIENLKDKGFRIEEVKGTGHNYGKEIERVAFNLIQ